AIPRRSAISVPLADPGRLDTPFDARGCADPRVGSGRCEASGLDPRGEAPGREAPPLPVAPPAATASAPGSGTQPASAPRCAGRPAAAGLEAAGPAEAEAGRDVPDTAVSTAGGAAWLELGPGREAGGSSAPLAAPDAPGRLAGGTRAVRS